MNRTANYYDVLNDSECAFLNHMSRWGSDGYPVVKASRKWFWVEAFGVKGSPVAYRTKREAFAAVEAYLETIRQRISERAKQLAA